MSIAIFGSKSFSVSSHKVLTFNELTFSGQLQVDTQEVDKEKPSTYIKGPGLEKLSFMVQLEASLGVDVRAEMDSWRSIRDAGQPQVFSIGGKPLSGNKWLLTSVEITDTVIDGAGRFSSAKLSLTFEEYVRPGKKEAAKGTSGTSSTKNNKSIEYYQERDKQDKKRTNPNANRAVLKQIKFLNG